VPLSASARRFLEPIVGVDPATVNVYQAPEGTAATRGADAVTVGNNILLAAGQAGESPEALGLLAHELTHVARERSAAGGAGVGATAVLGTQSQTSAGLSATNLPLTDPSATNLPPTASSATNLPPTDPSGNNVPPTGARSEDDRPTNLSVLSQPLADPGATTLPFEGTNARLPASEAPGEEAAARRVEGRVIAAAEAAVGPFSAAAPGAAAPLFRGPEDSLTAAQLAASARAAASGDTDLHAAPPLSPREGEQVLVAPPWNLEPTAHDQADTDDAWGGLPAPWQPLPAWLTSPNAFVTTADTAGLNIGHGSASDGNGSDGAGTGAAGGGAYTSGGYTGGGDTGGGGAAGGGGGAHFAETDRAVDVPAAQHTATPGGQQAVEPDLDALAHQVYTILKRRLASERRRLS
jgi:hypothetical protein